MRPNALARSLVGVTTAVGTAAGSLAGAGAGFAASAPVAKPAVNSEAAAPLAVVNLGLSTAQAQDVRRRPARYWGYTGAIDGIAGSGAQAAFKAFADGIWP
ncbi:hypothetical protein ACFYO0_41405 [Streptomyces sp. NPDC006365]|uniref:hypothetical protein n=1 Tax=Streptomyces sp. NPDC006365 TaxID=3364744 RepID=UPI0036AD4620